MDRTFRILRNNEKSGEFQANERVFNLILASINRQNREKKDSFHRGLEEKVDGSWVTLDLAKMSEVQND